MDAYGLAILHHLEFAIGDESFLDGIIDVLVEMRGVR